MAGQSFALVFEERTNLAALASQYGAVNANYPAGQLGEGPGACTRYFQVPQPVLLGSAAGVFNKTSVVGELNDMLANDATAVLTPAGIAFNACIFAGFDCHEVNGRSRVIVYGWSEPATAAGITMARVRIRTFEETRRFTDDIYAQFLAVDQRNLAPDARDSIDLWLQGGIGTVAELRPVIVPGIADAIPAANNGAVIGMKAHSCGGLTRLVVAVCQDAANPLY